MQYAPKWLACFQQLSLVNDKNCWLSGLMLHGPSVGVFSIDIGNDDIVRQAITFQLVYSPQWIKIVLSNWLPIIKNFSSFFYILDGGEITSKSMKCTYYVEIGDQSTMECPVEGNPRPNITWAVGGQSLSWDKSSITVTHQITGEHRYTCTADNGIGEPDSSTFLLLVNRKFRTVTNMMSTISEYKFKYLYGAGIFSDMLNFK